MIRRVIAMLLWCGILGHAALCSAHSKALFYMIEEPNSRMSFFEHADKIDILVPAWYSVDRNGLVWGGPNAEVMKVAAQHHVPVMPIVALMKQDELHELFTSPLARFTLTASLVNECKKNGYSGFQIDFENVDWTDRDLLSSVVAETASALHKEKLQLTVATVPNAPGSPGKSEYSHWLYENWRLGYDLKALAASADLICLMTYDQNTRWTPPGPVAGYPWTVDNLEYALRFVPKEKLLLGIPLYGYHWIAGEPENDKPNPTAEEVGQQQVEEFLAEFHPHVEWDATDRSAWFYFYRDDSREWVFYVDKRGFEERYKLVGERGLGGFCSWVLGTEDPEIWTLLPSHK